MLNDTHWQKFCQALGLPHDESLATLRQRKKVRDKVEGLVKATVAAHSFDTVAEKLHGIYEEVGGFGTLLLFCFDYADEPKVWRHSMELLAREVMPRFQNLVPK